MVVSIVLISMEDIQVSLHFPLPSDKLTDFSYHLNSDWFDLQLKVVGRRVHSSTELCINLLDRQFW